MGAKTGTRLALTAKNPWTFAEQSESSRSIAMLKRRASLVVLFDLHNMAAL
jgi:hypothetical protein